MHDHSLLYLMTCSNSCVFCSIASCFLWLYINLWFIWNWARVSSLYCTCLTIYNFSWTCFYFVFEINISLPLLMLNWNMLFSCVCLWSSWGYTPIPPHQTLVQFCFVLLYSFPIFWYWALNPRLQVGYHPASWAVPPVQCHAYDFSILFLGYFDNCI
jgi:hypothetical protein